MEIVPIRWHGGTRVERMRVLLLERVHAWRAQWAVAPARIDCALARLPAEPAHAARAAERWLCCTAAHGTAWLRVDAAAAEQLGCRLAGAVAGDGHGLAAGIGERALADLARELFASPAAGLRDHAAPDGLEPRRGWVGFACTLDCVRVELHLDHRLCDALVPAAVPAAALTPRAAAIGGAELTLCALLDLGAVDLQDTALLRPGEVIKTRIPLDRSIEVRTQAGRTLLAGTLVAAGGRRALRVTGRSP